MHLRDLQAEIRSRDYKSHIPHVYFLKLMEEVGELAEAIRNGARRVPGSADMKGTIDEELFDAQIGRMLICALRPSHTATANLCVCSSSRENHDKPVRQIED